MSATLVNTGQCEVHGCPWPAARHRPRKHGASYSRPLCGRHWYALQYGAVTILAEGDPL